MTNYNMPAEPSNELLPSIEEEQRQKDIAFIEELVEKGNFSIDVENHYYGYPKEIKKMLEEITPEQVLEAIKKDPSFAPSELGYAFFVNDLADSDGHLSKMTSYRTEQSDAIVRNKKIEIEEHPELKCNVKAQLYLINKLKGKQEQDLKASAHGDLYRSESVDRDNPILKAEIYAYYAGEVECDEKGFCKNCQGAGCFQCDGIGGYNERYNESR